MIPSSRSGLQMPVRSWSFGAGAVAGQIAWPGVKGIGAPRPDGAAVAALHRDSILCIQLGTCIRDQPPHLHALWNSKYVRTWSMLDLTRADAGQGITTWVYHNPADTIDATKLTDSRGSWSYVYSVGRVCLDLTIAINIGYQSIRPSSMCSQTSKQSK